MVAKDNIRDDIFSLQKTLKVLNDDERSLLKSTNGNGRKRKTQKGQNNIGSELAWQCPQQMCVLWGMCTITASFVMVGLCQ